MDNQLIAFTVNCLWQSPDSNKFWVLHCDRIYGSNEEPIAAQQSMMCLWERVTEGETFH